MTSTPSLVNSMAIETPTGFRTFNLYAGSITESTDPLLVVSSWRVVDYAGGQVIEALERTHNIDFRQLTPVVNFGNGVGTFEVQPGSSTPPWKLMLVGLPGAEGVNQPSDGLRELFNHGLWSLFGSLAALELRGDGFSSMSLPVIGGAREFEPEFVVSNLLSQSVEWLKTSKTMKTINVWVYDEDMIETWISAMDAVLDRHTVSSAGGSIAQALKEEVLVGLDVSDALSEPPFRDSALGIYRELKSDDESLHRLATFGRILVEQMAMKITVDVNLNWSGNLWEGITELGRREVIAPWIVSHFHTMRVLGNETVHGHGGVQYVPTDLQDSDLVPVLACLSRLLSFWESWVKAKL